MSEANQPRLRITLIKSPIGDSERHKRTVRALGLRRLRQAVEQADSGVVRGMLAKVSHLVQVESVPASSKMEGNNETARVTTPGGF